MTNAWRLIVWGVRGSAPAPGADYLEYGGNTSCFSLDIGDTLVVLDAGSGLAGLCMDMARRGVPRADILISHLHLDHILGLFSLPSRCDPAMELHLYSVPNVIQELQRLVGPPLWPVGLSGRVHMHQIQPGYPFRLSGKAAQAVTVTALGGNHPGGCHYYRVEAAGHSLVYTLDCELSDELEEKLTGFARDADLLIWDAGFSPGELKPGWGHSTWEQGLKLGRAAGVKQVLMSHYGVEHTDIFLRKQEQRVTSPGRFAKEGMVMEL